MAIHYIHVDAVGATAFRFDHPLAQRREICLEDRRGNFDRVLRHGRCQRGYARAVTPFRSTVVTSLGACFRVEASKML
jgi:hypothetical protein